MVYLRRLVLTAILMAVLGTTVQADDVRVGGLMANVPSLFSRTKTEELEKIYEDKSSGRKVEFLGFDAEGSKSATDPAFIKLIIDFLKIRLGGQQSRQYLIEDLMVGFIIVIRIMVITLREVSGCSYPYFPGFRLGSWFGYWWRCFFFILFFVSFSSVPLVLPP